MVVMEPQITVVQGEELVRGVGVVMSLLLGGMVV